MIVEWILAGLMLLVALFYVWRSVRRSFDKKHDCPDCDVKDVLPKK
jgi:hypothetical protein